MPYSMALYENDAEIAGHPVPVPEMGGVFEVVSIVRNVLDYSSGEKVTVVALEPVEQQDLSDLIVCPGCGWRGKIDGLTSLGACPSCGYENGLPPERLLTLSEMMTDPNAYNDVNIDLLFRSLIEIGLMRDPRKEK